MKIAILGTRGIPVNYGGPETNAENLAPLFVEMGHETTVYNPDEHPYSDDSWRGVTIRRIFCKESRFGIWGTLLYDYLCLRDAYREGFDVLLELGNVPCALFYPLRPRSAPKLVTNMDGLEWKRSKWNFLLQKFAKLTETLGARFSDALVADNEAIRAYLRDTYGRESDFIPYGAALVDEPDHGLVERFALQSGAYYMLVARLEPENNIETILRGYELSGSELPFLVVGGTSTKHARQLVERFSGNARIRFQGGLYDLAALDALRWNSKLYFHGHSVGGTNPSLIEAMASNAHIVAHENPFNRAVLGEDALYFSTEADVAEAIARDGAPCRDRCIDANREKVRELYDWRKIAQAHLRVFARTLNGS